MTLTASRRLGGLVLGLALAGCAGTPLVDLNPPPPGPPPAAAAAGPAMPGGTPAAGPARPAAPARPAPTAAVPSAVAGGPATAPGQALRPAAEPAPRPEPTAGLPAPALAGPAEPGPLVGPLLDPERGLAPAEIQADEQIRRDLWDRLRAGFRLPPLEVPELEVQLRWYGSRPDYVQRMTMRSSRYLFHIVEEVERRGLPTELALLPYIESAFNPQALSTAQASGMWQFIPSTGRDHDLRQNLFRDDRRDVLASTRAALDYLERLHGMFGDWHLALAAYNWGEGNVQRAMKRNERAGLPTGYPHLRMPAETRHYVPKLLAVKAILERPQDHGISLPPVENHPYFLAVPLRRDIDLALVARLARLPLEEVKALNPSMNKPLVLAAGTPQLLLPYDNARHFVAALAEHRGPLASWTAWQVPRTMALAEAARQIGCDEDALRELNKVPPRMLVKAGSTLLVPRQGEHDRDVSEELAENARLALAAPTPPGRKVMLTAGRKDRSVADLARRRGVGADQLAAWNQLKASSPLKAGQTLVAYLPPAKARAASAARQPAAPAKTTARAVAQAGAKAAARPAAKARPARAKGSEKRVAQAERR